MTSRLKPAFPLFFSAMMLLPAISLAQKTCIDDADCAGGKLCQAASCVKVAKDKSLLRVKAATPPPAPAYLYVDDVPVGELPFEGILSAGMHAIRVECQGTLPVMFQGESRAAKSDTITVELQPDPAYYAPVAPAPQPMYGDQGTPAQDGEAPIGRIHAGLYGGAGFGSAGWGAGLMRPAIILQGGLTAGAAVLREPIWMDVGLGVSSTSIRVEDWAPDFGDFLKLNFGLLVRLLFPLKDNFFYIGAELEPGYGLSNRRYGYVQLHLAMSLFVNDWLELRINPLGVEYCQELTFQGYILTGHATAGLVFRFGAF